MSLFKQIPNFLTLGNLFLGCLSIVFIFSGELTIACYLIFAAAIIDFFDGFVARLLKATSPIGKQLDSLSDVVSFGVVPGMICFHLLFINIEQDYSDLFTAILYSSPAFLISIAAATRLARFNIDTNSSGGFKGLPTPASAILIASLPLLMYYYDTFILSNFLIYTLILTVSYLSISNLPMFALKFKNYAWKGNEIKYIYLVSCLVALIILKIAAIPIVIFLYLCLSLVNNLIFSK